VPDLDTGAAVTTNRNDTHYVVTKFGVTDLTGKVTIQRGEALIGIANPDSREVLEKELRWIYKTGMHPGLG
jgi:4-hydroxybutyrate CoA-transferase